MLRFSTFLGAAAAVLTGLSLSAEPVKVILDTDMIEDFDDVGAMACLHAMADAGECEILATVSATRGNASVAAIGIINAYYGRAELPLGSPKGLGVEGLSPWRQGKIDPLSPLGKKPGGDGGHWKYRKLAQDYPEWVKYPDADAAPDANEVYRKALAAAPDKSVVICSIGFLTNLRRLLETQPDAISPLNGRDLVAQKVKKWVAMACWYPRGKEYNSMADAESSRIALENWPTPIVFSDWQYGHDIYAGRVLVEKDGPRNPVKDVFVEGNIPSREEVAKDPNRWHGACFGLGGRSSWDETAVLAAVRGETSYFNVERGRYRMIGNSGENEWAADAEGPHVRLVEKLPKDEVGKLIDELVLRAPKTVRKPTIRERKGAFERTSAKPLESAKLTFVGADGWDVYNCSIPFVWNGVRYIFGRLEKHEIWTLSHIALFRETAKDVWTKEPAFTELDLEDPYVQVVQGELIVGGTYINRDKDGKFLTYQGRFYRGKDPFSLEHFADGPDKMKDIRLTELPNGKIGVFSRPRGEEVRAKWGSEAVIGYAEIDSLKDFNADLVQNAPIIPGLFGKDEWGGCNQAYALKDGRILVAAHLSCGGAPATNGVPRQIYMNAAFVFDPKTFTASDPKIVATRCFYPANEPKAPSLDDCVFTSGFIFRDDGNIDVYTGLCDADEARCTIPSAALGVSKCQLFGTMK